MLSFTVKQIGPFRLFDIGVLLESSDKMDGENDDTAFIHYLVEFRVHY